MTTEKLEITREILTLTSLILIVIVFTLAISLVVVNSKISKNYKSQTEIKTTK